jgi:hypothetical protein
LRRIAATLKSTAIKKLNAKSVLLMLTSPHSRKRNLFLFCDFFWIGDHCRKWHNAHLRVIVTTFVILTAPSVQAQTPRDYDEITHFWFSSLLKIGQGRLATCRPAA